MGDRRRAWFFSEKTELFCCFQAASAEAQQILSHVGVKPATPKAFGRAPLMNSGKTPKMIPP